jgi:thymidine phosphorylase
MASWRLGAGRSRPCGTVPAAAGVICRAKPGKRVVTGQPIVELRGGDPARLEAAEAELAGAIGIGDDPRPPGHWSWSVPGC